MSIFRRPDYESEITQFLNVHNQQKPELEAQQSQGRELLWDKPLDRAAWSAYRAAGVAQQPYVYQTDNS